MSITSRLAATAATVATVLATLALAAPVALASGSSAAATRVGSAPAHQHLTVLLPLKVDQGGLARLATAVSTPGSDQYGQYRSLAALGQRFGASRATRAHVMAYLHRSGATDVAADRSGLFVSARLSVNQAQRLFGTQLSSYRTDARSSFVAPQTATHVPAALAGAVTGVVGLDTQPVASTPQPAPSSLDGSSRVSKLHSLGGSSALGDVDLGSAYLPRSGRPSGCTAGRPKRGGFTPNQYLKAYGLSSLHSSGINGRGERVALIEIDGFKPGDVTRFDRCYKLAMPKVKLYGVGIRRALAPGPETTLDLEVLSAAAPRLQNVDVYESSSSPSAVLRSMIDAIESRNQRPDVVSASLGGCEPQNLRGLGTKGINLYETAFELAAATGISVVAAAGDDGSSTCLNSHGNPTHKLAVSFPASSPFVTAVGGTNVKLNRFNKIVKSTVWNDAPGELAAAGGGQSEVFTEPSYQNGSQSSGRREIPDVSLLGDLAPGYEIYCSAKAQPCNARHGWLFIGGTSAGTPLLAGGIALADAALRKAGRDPIGFANPLLYEISGSHSAARVFSDVTTGSNDMFAAKGDPLGCCSAKAGYDDASGIGQINVAGLTAAARAIRAPVGSVAVAASSPQSIASRKLVVQITCSIACVQSATARIQIAGAGTVKLMAQPSPGVANAAESVKLWLSGKLAAKLRAALRGHHPVTATVVGTIVDGAGKVQRRSRPVRITLTS